MNYQKLYNTINYRAMLENRKRRNGTYYERHHIIPKSLGGRNIKENIALLTAKEHYICHILLIRIYKNDPPAYLSMLRALNMMRVKGDHIKRDYNFSGRLYENIKNELYGMGGLCLGENHPCYGRKNSPATIDKMKIAAQKRCANPKERKRLKDMALNRTPAHAEKIRKALTGRKVSEETKQRLSDSHLGNIPGNTKSVIIDEVFYQSCKAAGEALGVTQTTITNRIESNNEKFKNYLIYHAKSC